MSYRPLDNHPDLTPLRPCAAGHRLPSLSWFATRLWSQLAWLPLKVDSGAPRPRGDVIVDALLLQLARLEPCKSRHCPTAASDKVQPQVA